MNQIKIIFILKYILFIAQSNKNVKKKMTKKEMTENNNLCFIAETKNDNNTTSLLSKANKVRLFCVLLYRKFVCILF